MYTRTLHQVIRERHGVIFWSNHHNWSNPFTYLPTTQILSFCCRVIKIIWTKTTCTSDLCFWKVCYWPDISFILMKIILFKKWKISILVWKAALSRLPFTGIKGAENQDENVLPKYRLCSAEYESEIRFPQKNFVWPE